MSSWEQYCSGLLHTGARVRGSVPSARGIPNVRASRRWERAQRIKTQAMTFCQVTGGGGICFLADILISVWLNWPHVKFTISVSLAVCLWSLNQPVSQLRYSYSATNQFKREWHTQNGWTWLSILRMLLHTQSWYCHLLPVNLFTYGMFHTGVCGAFPQSKLVRQNVVSLLSQLNVCQNKLTNDHILFYLGFTHPNSFGWCVCVCVCVCVCIHVHLQWLFVVFFHACMLVMNMVYSACFLHNIWTVHTLLGDKSSVAFFHLSWIKGNCHIHPKHRKK